MIKENIKTLDKKNLLKLTGCKTDFVLCSKEEDQKAYFFIIEKLTDSEVVSSLNDIYDNVIPKSITRRKNFIKVYIKELNLYNNLFFKILKFFVGFYKSKDFMKNKYFVSQKINKAQNLIKKEKESLNKLENYKDIPVKVLKNKIKINLPVILNEEVFILKVLNNTNYNKSILNFEESKSKVVNVFPYSVNNNFMDYNCSFYLDNGDILNSSEEYEGFFEISNKYSFCFKTKKEMVEFREELIKREINNLKNML